MMEKIYLIMREKGLRTDGYYYESETSVIAATNEPAKAAQLLADTVRKEHTEDELRSGKYNIYGDTEVVFEISCELCDRFWIEEVYLK